MINTALEISKSIHAVLSADVSVQALLGNTPRLYDNLPEDPIYPYLTYGPLRMTDLGADEARITGHVMTLHIWSRYSGRAEVLSIIEAISYALENGLALQEDIHLVRSQVIYKDVFRAPDGLTLHGLIRASITTDTTLQT